MSVLMSKIAAAVLAAKPGDAVAAEVRKAMLRAGQCETCLVELARSDDTLCAGCNDAAVAKGEAIIRRWREEGSLCVECGEAESINVVNAPGGPHCDDCAFEKFGSASKDYL